MQTAFARWLIVTFAIVAAARSDPPSSPQAAALEFHRFQLPCSIRIVLVHAPQAKRQTIFTFMPLTLVNDDADRAQWAHLLEHMILRTTDADGLEADGVIFNGETTHNALRLETFAQPAHWKEALARHAKWITAREFTPQSLAQEKPHIAEEEQNTAARGSTNKFALAAWSQALMYGRARVNVHEDVQRATIEQVAEYARSHVASRVDDSMMIASIGPIPVAEVRAELERLLADVKPAPPASPQPATAPASQPANQPLHITWDLPTRHAMWWWPLPASSPRTVAAATAIAKALHMRLLLQRNVGKQVRNLIVTPAATTKTGTFLVVDACLAEGAAPDDLGKAVQDAAGALAKPGDPSSRQSIVFGGRLAAQEMPVKPDFEALRKQMMPQMQDSVEGLWLLPLMYVEFQTRRDAADFVGLLMNPDEQAVAEVLSRLAKPPSFLLLEPAH